MTGTPSDVVVITVLATDIEGSTPRWERAPDTMRAALVIHDAVVREAIARNDGTEIRHEGDSIVARFPDADGALRAAVALIDGLDGATWPTWPDGTFQPGLPVRVAIHHGAAVRESPDGARVRWRGAVFHRLDALCRCCHPGQIVLTEAARRGLTATFLLDDLGLHRLAGSSAAERVTLARAPSQAQRAFPPLVSADVRRTNLVLPPHAIVGRRNEIATIRAAFASGARVVTLVGAPGAGKTRVALEFATSHATPLAGGTWFCDLTEARTTDDVLRNLAATLDVPAPSGASPAVALGWALAARGPAWMLLDNCEGAAGPVAELLGALTAAAPAARFLATSRMALHTAGEHVVPIEPLAADDPASPAVQLFLARARDARPGFGASSGDVDAAATIARRLDGLPLAIEIVAARLRLVSLPRLVEMLDRSLDLASGRSGDRSHTLRAALDGSWDLLGEPERRAFARTSVFAGGFDLDAWLAVAGADGAARALSVLVDSGLVRSGADDGRFDLLAAFREYATGRLAPAERAEAEVRHGEWYADLADPERWAHVDAPDERRAVVAADVDNLWAAHERALRRKDARVASLCALGGVLVAEWRGPFADVLGRVLATLDLELDDRTRAALLSAAARMAQLGGLGAARTPDWLRQAADLARRSASPHLPTILAQLGMAHHVRGEVGEAERILGEAIDGHRAAGQERLLAVALGYHAQLDQHLGRYPDARARWTEAVEIHRRHHNLRSEAIAITSLAQLDHELGDLAAARAGYEAALAVLREVGDLRNCAVIRANMAALDFESGRVGEAEAGFAEVHALQLATGNRSAAASTTLNLAEIARARKDVATARARLAEALALTAGWEEPRLPGVIHSIWADVERMAGDLAAARAHADEAFGLLERAHDVAELVRVECRAGSILLASGDRAGAEAALDRARERAATLASPTAATAEALQVLARDLSGA